MARGRKITLHLVEGTANGIIKGEIWNWVGQVTFGKLTQLIDLATDEDVKRSGIYVLAGPDPDELNTESVYIGESENVANRLKQHDKNETKGYFERVAIITSKDENLTKGHIRYLESRLIDLAYQAGRATVANGTRPDLPPLPLADQDEMEFFLEHLELILPVLGLNFILPAPSRKRTHEPTQIDTSDEVESPIFYLITKNQATGVEVEAHAQILNGEFVILANSTALLRIDGGYAPYKERLIHNQSLIADNSVYRFTKDVPFNSPSAAAAIIRGQNTNGRTYWKLQSGETYGDWLDKQIEKEDINFDN